MDNVTHFRTVEMVFVDARHIAALAHRRGHSRAMQTASSALEKIAERVAAAEAAWRAGEFARLSRISRSLAGLSEAIGIETLGTVARTIAVEADRADDVTLAALVARLGRVSNASLAAIWDVSRHRF